MKKGWQTKTLGEACPISNRKPEAFAGTRRYFSTGAVGSEGELSEPELVDYANRPSRAGCMPEVGDIGFARMKGTKKVILIDEPLKGALFSTGFCFVAPRPNVEPRFAFYFVTSDDFQDAKNGVAGDGIMGGIKNSDAAAIGMPLPPLAEQRLIVGLLDEAFEGLAAAKANAEKNLQNARAIFESHLQSTFTQRGPGWEQQRMVELCSIITCGVASTPQYVDEAVGIPFLSAQNVKDGEVSLNKYRFISKGFHEKLTKKNKPQKGDVLYSRVGAKYGEAAVFEHDFAFSVYVSLTLIRPIAAKLDNYFLKHYLNSPSVRRLAKKCISSSGVPNLNVKDVREFPVSYPSIERQRKIVNEIELLYEETQRLARLYERKHAALEALKKSLLHEAFAGQLTAAA